MTTKLPPLSSSFSSGSQGGRLPALNSSVPRAEPTGDFDLNTWEGRLAANVAQSKAVFPTPVGVNVKAVDLFAGVQAAGQILPALWAGIPSQREAVMDSGVSERLLQDALWFIPYGKVFRGMGSLSRSAKFSLSKLSKHVSPPKSKLQFRSLSAAEKEMPERIRYLQEEGWKKVAKDLDITEREGFALWTGEHAGSNSIWWARNPTSGAKYGTEASVKFKKLFDKKGGLSERASKKVDYYKNTPLDVQKANHYRKAWKKRTEEIIGKEIDTDFDGMFKHQMELVLGRKAALAAELGTADARTMAGLWERSLDLRRHILKVTDPGYASKIPTVMLPWRKVLGPGEQVFGTASMGNRLKGLYETSNKWSVAQMHNLFFRLEDAGFGKVITKRMKVGIDKSGKGIYKDQIQRFKNAEWFNKDFEKSIGVLTSKLDEMSMLGKTAEEKWAYLTSVTKEGDKLRTFITDVHKPFTDDLYQQYMTGRITQLFELESNLLTPAAKAGLEEFLVGVQSKANALFPKAETLLDPKISSSAWTKTEGVKQLVDEVRNIVNPEIFRKAMPDGKPVSLGARQAAANRIIKGLTFSEKGKPGFANYIENYAARAFKTKIIQTTTRMSKLHKEKHQAFVNARTKDLVEEDTLTYFQGMQSRIAGQGRELYINPYMDNAIDEIARMPKPYMEAFEHWISRMNGEVTTADVKVAKILTANIGGLTKILGLGDVIKPRQVISLGHTITDLTFLGGLGFKPHSAVRNLFQTMLNVPTDLGGVKDFGWLARGYKRAMRDPASRQYIRDIGAIGEYAEELYLHGPKVKFNPKVKGVELDWQRFRDVGMWMFKKSDQFNRYVTGGAAMTKWEAKAAKHLGSGKWHPERMIKDMKFAGREPDVRQGLEALVRRADRVRSTNPELAAKTIEQAKQTFIKDVIADTQWLYGKAEAPLINSRWGVVSKTGVIFQSWWMNYLASLEKWARTPGVIPKLDRFGTWVISAAVAGEIMEWGAGFKESKVKRTVGIGPIPRTINEFMIPSPWRPMYEAMNGLGDVIQGDFDSAKRRGVQFLRSGMMYVPGGLQLGSIYRDVKKFGPGEGLARSITGYYSDLER